MDPMPTVSAPSQPTPHRMPHVGVLDGIRALAIITVYLAHAGLGSIIPGGLGVTIFFFLSGYLITSLLRAEYQLYQSVNFAAFYTRRLLRLVPPLWITVAVAAIVVQAGLIASEHDGLGVISQLLFFSNYAELYLGGIGYPALPLWSLAVEEHFYLLFPILFVLGCRRFTFKNVAAMCFAFCLAVLAVRVVYVLLWNETYSTYYMTHTRIDSILFGCMLALWNNPVFDERAWKPSANLVMTAAAFLLLTIAYRNTTFRETVRYSIQGLALFVLFSAALWSSGVVKTILTHPVLRRIGLYSYTIYLIHFLVINVIAEHLGGGSMVLAGALAILPTWFYAAVMYRIVERPLGVVRRRLDRGQSSAPAGQDRQRQSEPRGVDAKA